MEAVAAEKPSATGRGLAARYQPLGDKDREKANLDFQGSAGLFVGVGQFDAASGLPTLAYTPDDAVALADVFVRELSLLPPANVRLALGGVPKSASARTRLEQLRAAGVHVLPATRQVLLDAVMEVADLANSPGGIAIMSFGTHGFEDRGIAFVMPADGRRRLVSSSGVSLQMVKDVLRESKAGKKLLLLDACREALNSDVRGEDRMKDGLREAFKAAEGFAVMASCSPGQLSWESPELEQGVFTHFLLRGLRGEAGTAGGDSFIRLGRVSEFAARGTRDWVRQHKSEAQEPWFEGEIGRNIPVAVDTRVAAEAAELDRRRTRALDLLTDARKKNRDLLSLRLEEEIESTLKLAGGKELAELLEQIEELSDPRPARVRGFLAWWQVEGARVRASSVPQQTPKFLGELFSVEALAVAKEKAQRIQCVNNLKQLGLAFRIWALDNGDTYPTSLVELSNELSATKVLVCPTDTNHTAAPDWKGFNAGLHTSYIVDWKVRDETDPQLELARCPIHTNVLMNDGAVLQRARSRVVQDPNMSLITNLVGRLRSMEAAKAEVVEGLPESPRPDAAGLAEAVMKKLGLSELWPTLIGERYEVGAEQQPVRIVLPEGVTFLGGRTVTPETLK